MYFWNTRQLAEDIRSSKLSDNDWKNYFLAVSILATLVLYLTSLAPRAATSALLLEVILMIGILRFGISVTFNTHKTNDKNVAGYISKIVALSLPLSIKLMALSLGFGIILGILEAGNQEWLICAVTVTIQALLFWRLNIHLQAINT